MWKVIKSYMKLMAALDLAQFLCIAWLKSNMRGSSEEALQPKPNSSSDKSGFIWMEQLSKVQIFIFTSSVKNSLHTYIAIRQHHIFINNIARIANAVTITLYSKVTMQLLFSIVKNVISVPKI